MNDDFEDDAPETDSNEASFDDFEKKQNTLGDLWRNNPVVKIGVIAGVAILVLGAIFIFGSSKKPVEPSVVSSGSDIKAAPGTEETSPAYVAAVQEQSDERIEKAFKEGGSALPTPIEPPRGTLEADNTAPETEDPLQRWRKLQEERLQKELQKTQTTQDATQIDNTKKNQAVQALADVMSQQMQAILEKRSAEAHMKSMGITDPNYLTQLQEQQQQEIDQAGQNQAQVPQEVLVPAGQIAYAQLLTEANSDVPGPILAQIASGPLKGDRILGSFQVQQELLTLTFKTVVIDGVSQTMNAIALDPKTTLAGMATDVNHRYFKRIVLPAAAAFIEGAARAAAETGLTSITFQGDTVATDQQSADSDQKVSAGVEEAGQKLREILDQEADQTKVLIRIEKGTPMGVLFLDPVLKPTDPALGISPHSNPQPLPVTAASLPGLPADLAKAGAANTSASSIKP